MSDTLSFRNTVKYEGVRGVATTGPLKHYRSLAAHRVSCDMNLYGRQITLGDPAQVAIKFFQMEQS